MARSKSRILKSRKTKNRSLRRNRSRKTRSRKINKSLRRKNRSQKRNRTLRMKKRSQKRNRSRRQKGTPTSTGGVHHRRGGARQLWPQKLKKPSHELHDPTMVPPKVLAEAENMAEVEKKVVERPEEATRAASSAHIPRPPIRWTHEVSKARQFGRALKSVGRRVVNSIPTPNKRQQQGRTGDRAQDYGRHFHPPVHEPI